MFRIRPVFGQVHLGYAISEVVPKASKLPMLITVPALFAAVWYGFDPAMKIYDRLEHPPRVAIQPSSPKPVGPPLDLTPVGRIAPERVAPTKRHRKKRQADPTDLSNLLQPPDPDAPYTGHVE